LANKINFLNQNSLNPMNQKRGERVRRNSIIAPVTPAKQPAKSPITASANPVTTDPQDRRDSIIAPVPPVKPPTKGPIAASANPASTDPQDIFDRQILDLVNQERAKVGADPLKINEQLDLAADLHTLDQAKMNKMSHTGSNGSTMGDRITNAGYVFSSAGENVAYGFADAAAVVKGWMNSEGHRKNILNPNYKEIGVGYAEGADGRPYWTQDFGTSLT
jgi:uncharacterized protein YkwD